MLSDKQPDKRTDEHDETNRRFILVVNQLDAQNLFYSKFYFMPLHVSSTMCSSSGGRNCTIQPLVSSHTAG